ncbi:MULTISPECIES: DUF502 domain-containing protein [Arenibacter]|uniref:Uncharacterized membrane protein n=1 Tax=Arenibacter palladensis TaxID=237373 RepID=A0A1M5DTI0_9FLAO|nr:MULTISPECIES: DUF502 domain-containing protein [Arenibacter]MCK0134426.1 DUF502 domain-containing protein [Arenibacter sp. S6351L]MDO6603055.1 DUF502 domain-containing protein [Arenibacter palladensis]SHF70226.1 Uncharacterized membrane protein [Arenibacter palladensis]
MKRIVNYFLQGLLYIAPLGITAYIIYVIFNFIDNLLHDKLEEIFKIDIPGLGLAVIFIFLVLVGIAGQSIFAQPFKVLFKRILEKAPLLKLIFSALNDLFSAFVGKEKKFNKPVMVLVNPISNLEKLGFLTEEDLSILDEKEKVAVYFPHSYNFSGELFIVPKNQVRLIDVNPSAVMKFILSGGVSGIDEEEETPKD